MCERRLLNEIIHQDKDQRFWKMYLKNINKPIKFEFEAELRMFPKFNQKKWFI